MLKKLIKKIRRFAMSGVAGIVIYRLVWLYSFTIRLKIENEDAWLDDLKKGGRVLLCAWHQQIFIAVKIYRRYRKHPVCVMISKSQDGEVAARLAQAAGAHPIRGSSSRDGGIAMKEMINFIIHHRFGAHLLDGPRGPAGVVKPGAIAIAQGAGAAVVPAYVKVNRAWYLRSWDRFMIPKPFSCATVTFHPPFWTGSFKDEQTFEQQRKKLEDILRPHLLP
jgi:hypothetical protein